MTRSSPATPYPISFSTSQAFLDHDMAQERLDKAINGDVTLSAVPDGAGGARWEARTSHGGALPLFRLTIKPETAEPQTAAARVPVVIDATEGVYVCYEDEARQQSWCVKVK